MKIYNTSFLKSKRKKSSNVVKYLKNKMNSNSEYSNSEYFLHSKQNTF